jgi:diaminopimelate decarboxylase
LRVKIKELEMKIDNQEQKTKDNLHSFHIHEQQNEKMFDKFENKIDAVFDVVNEVKNILITKNFN